MTREYRSVEGEIRTDQHRANFFRLLEDDISEIINPHRDEFVHIRCPNCDNGDTPEAFVKGHFSYSICPSCDTLFVNPRPNEERLSQFYLRSKAVAASTQSLLDNEKGRTKHIFIPRAKQILNFLKAEGKTSGKLLEVGCSVGTFLHVMKTKSDFSLDGLDPNQKACEVAKKRDIKVHNTTLEAFAPPRSRYDVVLNFETIEHIFSPYRFLVKVNRIMKRGGYLAFTTPNYHGFDMMVLGKHYKNIHAPCHLNYFNVDSIDLLLKRAGFKVLEKTTPGILDVGIVRKQVDEGVAPSIPAVIRHIVFNTTPETQEKFQRFLRENRLSGNMLIFAKKDRGEVKDAE